MFKCFLFILVLAVAAGCSDDKNSEVNTDEQAQSQQGEAGRSGLVSGNRSGAGGEAGEGGEAGAGGENIPNEKPTYDEATGECHNARSDCGTLDEHRCQEARQCQLIEAQNAEGETQTACIARCTPNVGLLQYVGFACFEIDGGFYATHNGFSQWPENWHETDRSNCAFADPLLCPGRFQYGPSLAPEACRANSQCFAYAVQNAAGEKLHACVNDCQIGIGSGGCAETATEWCVEIGGEYYGGMSHHCDFIPDGWNAVPYMPHCSFLFDEPEQAR